ncbi:ketoacyl-ACP synthase III [Oceanimonas sp. NS1]|nr:ketoacyl-ACP synthase III [Oceanimonas sp. NS1]
MWEQDNGVCHKFWVVEESRAVIGRYPFDEDGLVEPAIIEGNTIKITSLNQYNTIENVVALTKRINYKLSPDVDGKWVFGQVELIQKLPERFSTLEIVRVSERANKFSCNAIKIDGNEIGEIRFIVGGTMIGIRAIASFVPENVINNLEQAEKLGETKEFITHKIGAYQLPYMADGMETSDMAVAAAQKLIAKHEIPLDSIDALIVVTQNGDAAGLPHTAAIVQSKLGLSNRVAAFDVSLGCSGYVYGLSVIKGLMEQAGLKNGLLVTADPYSKIIDRNDRITTLLFGDAATATWLTEDSFWKFGKPLLATDGEGAANLQVEEGNLSMNGRQVFNFASKKVPAQIRDCLLEKGLEPDDIDVFCLHQGSASIVEAIAKRFPEVSHRFLSDIKDTGNTISSSIPLLLERQLDDEMVNKILISGFGVGLSWATNVLHREK